MTKTPEIGPTIQAFRKDQRLTLGQLAETSGVSKSMLSQIERGQANPTFAVLWSLTRALGIEISDLIDGSAVTIQDDAINVVTDAATPQIKSADGGCTLKILGPPQLAGGTEWYDVSFSPGASLDSAPHAPGTMEHFTALSDTFEVTSGDALRMLQSGDTARYNADVAHRITNTSTKLARGLLVVINK